MDCEFVDKFKWFFSFDANEFYYIIGIRFYFILGLLFIWVIIEVFRQNSFLNKQIKKI